MTTSAVPSNAAPAERRLWGSELLLRKVPLYAQARQYAATNAEDPRSEGNTLGYGVSSYPLLACVRAAYEAVNQDESTAAPASSLAPVDADLIDRSAFCGIQRAGYAHVPAQRKWMSTSALEAELAAATAASSSSSTTATAVVRRAAAAAVLDDALGPPTLAHVLEPWFGVIEDRLTSDAQVQVGGEATATATTTERAAPSQNANGDGVPPEERLIDADALRCRRRTRLHEREAETHGAVYTRVESAMMHYSAATPEEKEMLRSVRVRSNDTDSSGGEMQRVAATTAVPPEMWGSRMLSLVTTAVATKGGPMNDEKVEQQQKVLAYLKRVRWIATQWSSTSDPSALKDAAATPSWSQLTEATRVKTEMAHTQGQRRRFRRTRRGAASGATNADEGESIDE